MQKKQPESAKTRQNQQTRNPGQNTINPNKRAKANGNRPATGSNGTYAGTTIHLLKPLVAIPRLKAIFLSGEWKDIKYDLDIALLKHFKTQAQQLRAIRDMYSIVKAQPIYKNMKEPKWTAETHPLDVLIWLLRKLGRLAKGAEWTVDTCPMPVGDEPGYRFVIYKNYHHQRVTYRIFNFPLEFLPKILKSDRQLHDLIIDTVAYLSKNANIPFWDADTDYSSVIAKLTPINQLEPGTRLHLLNSIYQKYPAANYLKLLKQRRKVVTAEDVLLKIKNWNAKFSERRYRILNWVHQCLKLKGNLAAQTFIPNYMADNANVLPPQRHFKFVWSIHGQDPVNAAVQNKWPKSVQFLPVAFSIAGPGQVLKPIVINNFPVEISDLMKWTETIFLRLHSQYFFGNQMVHKSISEIMLENQAAGIKPKMVDGKLLINIL